MKYKHVIWDWNGTLLDDVSIAIGAINKLLKRRRMPLLDEIRYRSIFTFPVKEYYRKLGFSFSEESFEKLTAEFITEYRSLENDFRLSSEAEDVLGHLDSVGISQYILSASREKELKDIVDKFGIKKYFREIAGLSDHYAGSKEERGRQCLLDQNLKPEEVMLVGDTTHDYEVAVKLGCDCLLIAGGHQSYEQLHKVEAKILNSLSEAVHFIKESTAFGKMGLLHRPEHRQAQ